MATQDDGSAYRLKSLHHEAVQAALEKAERYRLLNEPGLAESICRDILRVEPDNQQALVTMILALTDQFAIGLAGKFDRARALAERLEGEYERAYYSGIICERRAKAQHLKELAGAGQASYRWLREAMDWYEKAEKLAAPDNDDALLRWNTCVRMIRTYSDIQSPSAESAPILLE